MVRPFSGSNLSARIARAMIDTACAWSIGRSGAGARGGSPPQPLTALIAPIANDSARPRARATWRRDTYTHGEASRERRGSLVYATMPRFAAIDVGSNALRLRIIEASSPSKAATERLQLPLMLNEHEGAATWREVVSLRASVRLGSEVFLSGRLAPASIGQACEALREFRGVMDNASVDAYRATATSAVREARNGATLVERARREARIELEPIEGIEEARLIQLAVTRRLPLHGKKALLVDVGGGSTELTVLDSGVNTFSMSLPLGTVRLLELFLRGSKTVDRAREKLVDETIRRAIGEALPQLASVQFQLMIGTGGNIETLCDLCPSKGGFGGHPRAIDVAQMKALFKKLCGMTAAERKEEYNLRPDRADTIVPA